MEEHIVDLHCPNCGAPVGIRDTLCQYCDSPITITSFSSVYSMPLPQVNKYIKSYSQSLKEHPNSKSINLSIAFCYLKLKMYDQAISAFAKSIEDNFDNSESYFYGAVALLRGKKAFMAKRPDINLAIEYLDAANMIEPKGIYYYFLAYIKYDYFARKHFRIIPDYVSDYEKAKELGYSPVDFNMLYELLGVECPMQLKMITL